MLSHPNFKMRGYTKSLNESWRLILKNDLDFETQFRNKKHVNHFVVKEFLREK